MALATIYGRYSNGAFSFDKPPKRLLIERLTITEKTYQYAVPTQTAVPREGYIQGLSCLFGSSYRVLRVDRLPDGVAVYASVHAPLTVRDLRRVRLSEWKDLVAAWSTVQYVSAPRFLGALSHAIDQVLIPPLLPTCVPEDPRRTFAPDGPWTWVPPEGPLDFSVRGYRKVQLDKRNIDLLTVVERVAAATETLRWKSAAAELTYSAQLTTLGKNCF